jgi:A/G-specific adenine glycosylase
MPTSFGSHVPVGAGAEDFAGCPEEDPCRCRATWCEGLWWVAGGLLALGVVGGETADDVGEPPTPDSEASGLEPDDCAAAPSELSSRHATAITSRTTAITSSRRTQYTREGNGPEGRIRLLMSPTLTATHTDLWHHRCDMPHGSAYRPLVAWYRAAARDLPWRRPGTGGWEVLVSEVMLQQTPVARVLPVYAAWLDRWPTPAALARDSVGDAVRMWGRLGYPRRAARLWQAARAIDSDFDGVVPGDLQELRSLPGVGEYTAAAVAAFAYRRRAVVLDTNVRRVLARLVRGEQFPARSLTSQEREAAEALVPDDGPQAAAWSVAVMELGALVCTARAPRCERCPVRELCVWRAEGYPPYAGPARARQTYTGTDRQCRGRILAALRSCDGPVDRQTLSLSWEDAVQRERAISSLLDDGLVVQVSDSALALP